MPRQMALYFAVLFVSTTCRNDCLGQRAGQEYSDRTLLVEWCDAESARVAQDEPHPLLRALGGAVTWVSRYQPRFSVVHVDPRLIATATVVLREVPGVRRVTRDSIMRGSIAPNDDYWNLQTGMRRICIEQAWDVRTDGVGHIIAIVDRGVQFNLNDLKANTWSNTTEVNGVLGQDDDSNGVVDDYNGASFVELWDDAYTSPNDPLERTNGITFDHGTPIASIAGAIGNNETGQGDSGIAGAAWTCTIMPVKVAGNYWLFSGTYQGLEYAYANGARIINCSWHMDDDSAAEYLKEFMLYSSDALYVVAANNANQNLDPPSTLRQYPASLSPTVPNMIVVGASTDTDTRWHASQHEGSNWGATIVHVFAPGEFITSLSSLPSTPYARYSGTSLATPIVSGVASLVWGKFPSDTALQVKARILNAANPVAPGHPLYGLSQRGLVNAAAALGGSCP